MNRVKPWAGRRVRGIVLQVLRTKGTVCHLCDEPGADSADHDPPRSVLIAQGVPDPDALAYLFPAHRYPCNVRRRARPITEALRVELRAARAAYLRRRDAARTLSPRLAERRPTFLRGMSSREGSASAGYPRTAPEKNRRTR